MFARIGLMAIGGALLYGALACGVIYFIFWCLESFGILGALGV